MVEMWEVSNILKNATPNSLVLLDEVGRGTSTYDGLSIAWSVIEYISNNDNLKCKTLFATHYHELTKLEGIIEGVKNDQVIFLRKIIEGGADQSYGIEVAKLAGLPFEVIDRAKDILTKLENEKSIEIDKLFNNYREDKINISKINEEAAIEIEEVPSQEKPITTNNISTSLDNNLEEKLSKSIKEENLLPDMMQLDFNMLEKESLLKDIANIEVMTMTPLDAMNTLFKIVQDAKKLK